MSNRLTINFDTCSPAPLGGYNLFYRIKGSSEALRFGGNFTASPAVIIISADPDGTLYEGFIQSNCISRGLGAEVPFVNQSVNHANFSLNNISGCGFSNSTTLYFLGNEDFLSGGTLANGTIVYYDAELHNPVLDFPFLASPGSVYFSINQSTGAVTLAGAC